jgi:hypothetical protein
MSEFDDVKPYSELTIVERMRGQLRPSGTLPVVGLHLNDRFFNVEFIEKCIAELERMEIRAAIGDAPSNLEKLAYTLLCDSAFIDPEHDAKQKAWLKKEGLSD